jgi:hypothetical protein
MTTTAASRLDAIAVEMRTILQQTDARFVHRKLAHGLELVLQRTGRQYRLALGRPGVTPSDSEIEICARSFRVPADAEPHRTVKQRPGKTGLLTYHVAELYWTETE